MYVLFFKNSLYFLTYPRIYRCFIWILKLDAKEATNKKLGEDRDAFSQSGRMITE